MPEQFNDLRGISILLDGRRIHPVEVPSDSLQVLPGVAEVVKNSRHICRFPKKDAPNGPGDGAVGIQNSSSLAHAATEEEIPNVRGPAPRQYPVNARIQQCLAVRKGQGRGGTVPIEKFQHDVATKGLMKHVIPLKFPPIHYRQPVFGHHLRQYEAVCRERPGRIIEGSRLKGIDLVEIIPLCSFTQFVDSLVKIAPPLICSPAQPVHDRIDVIVRAEGGGRSISPFCQT